MIRAVVFDFNGVLVDDEHLHFELFREVLAAEGVDLTPQLYHERYLGYDDRMCFAVALADAGQDAGAARLDALVARKAVRYGERAAEGLRYFPGAAACVKRLAGRYPLAINSGALRPEIEFALSQMGVRECVASIVSAEDATRCKPDPQGYLLALDALRLRVGPGLRAEECLVLEDSLAGIASAVGAGMVAVGVANTYPPGELLAAGAATVLDGLAGLTPEWVERQFTLGATRRGPGA